MYVRAGRLVFARPCEGVHRSTSLMSSCPLLQQCATCLVRLILIVFVMGGRWPYSNCFLGCCFQTCSKLIAAFLCSCRQAFYPKLYTTNVVICYNLFLSIRPMLCTYLNVPSKNTTNKHLTRKLYQDVQHFTFSTVVPSFDSSEHKCSNSKCRKNLTEKIPYHAENNKKTKQKNKKQTKKKRKEKLQNSSNALHKNEKKNSLNKIKFEYSSHFLKLL